MMPNRWLNWTDLPWLHESSPAARLIPLCEEILSLDKTSVTTSVAMKEILPDIAAEFAAPWCALMHRTPQWEMLVNHGRQPVAELPKSFLSDVLDRGSAGIHQVDSQGWKFIAAPVALTSTSTGLLVLAARGLADEALPSLLVVAKAVGQTWSRFWEQERSAKRVDQLRATLRIASQMSLVHETQPLLEQIAIESTRLLECDRASIFVWDKEHHEVVACPALGVEGGVLRLPDKAGIIGEVIHSGKLIRLDDAYRDHRFNQKVDAASGYRTKNLLCVPLFDAENKLIGAFEVINKLVGCFTVDDEITLRDLCSQVAVALQNTREREALVRSHRQLTEQVTQGVTIIGDSQPIQALRSTIRRLAATDLPVLILGESGTGKEVVAQALHFQGPRAERPFVAVNCAALTETLLESELFGHEKGAFTDAHEMRRGKFELAEGGTLFLDEIGDMSVGGQAKLLRVLEQKVITRVGGSQTIPVNTRVIAATNVNLADAVRAKKFREDLYFRLNVVTLDLPALRERPEDVLLLAEHFLGIFSTQARRPHLLLSTEAKRRLQSHGWPGNVRELRNLMERVAFLSAGEKVEAEDLAFILSPDPHASFQEPSPDMGLSEATNQFQQEFIRRSIKRVRGNMSEAARLLGLHRSNLYRKMRQLGMSEAGSGEDDDDGE